MDIPIKVSAYREFETKEEAERWAQLHYADLMNLPPEDDLRRIIYLYTGNYDKICNHLLRTHPPLHSDEFNKIDFGEEIDDVEKIYKIDRVLRSYSLPENIIVYRFTHKGYVRELCNATRLLAGMEFSDRAFLSTTLVKRMLNKFRREHQCDCLLKLYLPKGFPGAYVSLKTEKSCLDEQEFLLPPNIKFRISKIHNFTFPLEIDCIAICDQQEANA